jgi:hypothetical protein
VTWPAPLDDHGLLEAAGGGREPRRTGHRLARAIDPAGRSLARRDAALLEFHRRRYGPELLGVADCPGCGEAIEVALAIDLLRPTPEADGPFEIRTGEWRVEFVLPGADAVASAADERALAEMCVVAATRLPGDTPHPPSDLPVQVLSALGERMDALHPAADVRIRLTCEACGEAWTTTLDVAEMIGARATAEALQVMDEVHVLARSYGWSERDVLSLSRPRRRAYVDLVT